MRTELETALVALSHAQSTNVELEEQVAQLREKIKLSSRSETEKLRDMQQQCRVARVDTSELHGRLESVRVRALELEATEATQSTAAALTLEY